jgi:hypothetical protein
MPQPEAELTLQLEQSLFVSLDVHLLSGYRNFKRPLFIDKKSTAGRVSCQASASSVKAVPKTLFYGKGMSVALLVPIAVIVVPLDVLVALKWAEN